MGVAIPCWRRSQFLGIASLYTDTFTLLTITKSHDDVRAITKQSEDIFRIGTNYNYILIEFTKHQVNIFGLYQYNLCAFLLINQRTNGPVNAHLRPEIYICTNTLVRLEWYNACI